MRNNPCGINLPVCLFIFGTVALAGCVSPVKPVQNEVSAAGKTAIYSTKGTLEHPDKPVPGDTSSQNNHDAEIFPDDKKISCFFGTHVDILPQFKGGPDSFLRYIRQNIKYPGHELRDNAQESVVVAFVVDKNGKVKSPTIVKPKDTSSGFCSEVLRAMNNMPDWIPGERGGKLVDFELHLPVHFRLDP